MIDGYSPYKGMQYDSDSDDSSDYGLEVKDLAKGLADARNESKVDIYLCRPIHITQSYKYILTHIKKLCEIIRRWNPRASWNKKIYLH